VFIATQLNSTQLDVELSCVAINTALQRMAYAYLATRQTICTLYRPTLYCHLFHLANKVFAWLAAFQ